MKRVLALFLALLVCLSLCACGKGNENTNSTTGVGNSDSQFVNHPLYAQLFGTWELIDPESKDDAPVAIPFDVLTINEDKTCVIDGVNASWRFSTMYGNATTALEIEILVEGKRFCGAVLQDMGLMAVTENLALCGTTHCKKPQ